MARKTGPDKRIVEMVRDRAGGLCERCGFAEFQQVHHRKARRAGGTRDPAINYPSNLVGVCQVCHHFIEMNRAESLESGWLVASWESPVVKPIVYRGTWRLLDDEGGWILHADP